MRNCLVFPAGQDSRMVGQLWNLTKVTVREQANLSELQNLCRVSHPSILLLMGVSQHPDLGLQLVFQHVALGSLHHWLHVQVKLDTYLHCESRLVHMSLNYFIDFLYRQTGVEND